jgi:uncharacterized protein (TIGR02646 family)
LPNPEKADVHEALLEEQGYICCYCGRRVNTGESHIEHLVPRKLCRGRELDYTNMLASCEGGTRDSPPSENHCGHRKDNWYESRLFVSPLDPDCESYFTFTTAGEILPVSDPARAKKAKETIRRLGLDISKLTRMRREALEPIIEGIDSLTADEGKFLLTQFNQRDTSGRYTPFCFAIVSVLRQYFHT